MPRAGRPLTRVLEGGRRAGFPRIFLSLVSPMSAKAAYSQALHEKCLENVADVLQNVDTVSYIASVMKELGRELKRHNIKCVPSHEAPGAGGQTRGGTPVTEAGYIWIDSATSRRGDIVLHEDQLLTKDDVERSLRHEMIHAFDDARGYLEPTNCFHHACSEIRAARLSGDCLFSQEVLRGNVDVLNSGRLCVRRRAALSVEHNPMCRSFGERSVDVVFNRCYNDFEPFVAPIYSMGNSTGAQAAPSS